MYSQGCWVRPAGKCGPSMLQRHAYRYGDKSALKVTQRKVSLRKKGGYLSSESGPAGFVQGTQGRKRRPVQPARTHREDRQEAPKSGQPPQENQSQQTPGSGQPRATPAGETESPGSWSNLPT